MNIAKLKKLKKWILDEPRRYNQDCWLFGRDSDVVREQKPPCGTAGCLAGNACLMEGFVPRRVPWDYGYKLSHVVLPGSHDVIYVREKAEEILGLTEEQRIGLFAADLDGWPAEAQQLYDLATTPKQRAEAAAMAIDALIETGRRRKAKKRS